MRRLGLVIAIGLLAAACGGSAEPADDEGADAFRTGTINPCALADESVLRSYFGDEEVEAKPSEAGPVNSCSWRDANANDLLIQVASNYDLRRPDPCDDCIRLSYADDGYATASIFQSTAAFVVGTDWYSVTTTGFADDVATIASLGRAIFRVAPK